MRLVLVHGFTQTSASWRHIRAELPSFDDRETVAIDAPGHGVAADVRADLWEAADHVAARGGRSLYVGYSMGARIVLHLALRHPELVAGMVLLGGTAGIDDLAGRTARRSDDEALADSIERDGVAAFLDRWLAQPLFAGVPDDPEERAARLGNTASGLAWSLRLAGTGTQDPPLWDRLTEIGAAATPTLVLAGDRDAKFGALGRRLAAGIGPCARFDAVASAGHAAHLEQPKAFAELVTTFSHDVV